MPDLTLGAKGAAVIEAQSLLDRDGALLSADGAFGHGTYLAVREFQANHQLPVTGEIDDNTWQALRSLPDASPDIPIKAVTFIAIEEVGSRAYFETHCARPDYPGGASGVTIGVGYDSDISRPAPPSATNRPRVCAPAVQRIRPRPIGFPLVGPPNDGLGSPRVDSIRSMSESIE
jgi:peptidoglycan hydrolase-like protein with peptidoglycan-binding domain